MPAHTQVQPQPPAHRRLRMAAALLAIVALAVTFSACGGSSGSSSGTNSASSAKSDNARSSHFASLRSCLQKEGINLPTPPSGGAGRPGRGGFPGGHPGGRPGGFKLPEGVSHSKFQEALKKCGGSGFPGGARPGFNSSAARAALTKYATCMRENGINLPAPNTSGKGPIFNTSGINTSSEKFKAAQKTCQSDLRGAFGAGRPPAGGPPAGGPAGGPPVGGGAPPAGGDAPPAGGYGLPPGSGAEEAG